MKKFARWIKLRLGVIIALSCLTLTAFGTQHKDINKTKRPNWIERNFSLSANTALTSNYIWRGVSQTNNGPAMEGEFKVKTSPGFYGSIWGSNVNFADADNNTATTEFDYTLGFERKIGDFGINVGNYFYTYPKAKGINYSEPFASLSYKLSRLRRQISFA